MKGYVILFAIAIVSDSVVQWFAIPVPGSIIGMIVLVGWFTATNHIAQELAEAARTLLKYLAMLLVPVGVSVVELSGVMDGTLALMIAVSVSALLVAVIGTVGIVKTLQWIVDVNALHAIFKRNFKGERQDG